MRALSHLESTNVFLMANLRMKVMMLCNAPNPFS